MLYLIGEREMNKVFSPTTNSPSQVFDSAAEVYSKRPHFFTPYRNPAEFVGECIAPVVYPFVGGGLSLVSLAVAPVAFAVSIVSKLVAAVASLFGNDKFSKEANEFSGNALKFSGITLATSVIAAALAVASFFHSLASIVTRSIATIAALTTGYTDGYVAEVDEDDDHLDEQDFVCLSPGS